jgi:PAS domain-containing protein
MTAMERLPTQELPDESDASPESAAFTATATIDEQGIVTGWSEGARRLPDYAASEVVGRPAAGLLADGVGETPPQLPSGRRRWSGTLPLQHRDGHRLELRLLAHHQTPDRGTPSGVWCPP